ncbi:MAG: hypothetical protein HQL25_03985 [Candidatus Omnitrophica bacterium]|nr:hypothetical protein [Candidatus Omnitrophota bacterium]
MINVRYILGLFLIIWLGVSNVFAAEEKNLYEPAASSYLQVLSEVRNSERDLVFVPSAENLSAVFNKVDMLQKEFFRVYQKTADVVDQSSLEKIDQGIRKYQQDLMDAKRIIEQNDQLMKDQSNAFSRMVSELKQWRKEVKDRANNAISAANKDPNQVELWVNRTNVLNLLVEAMQDIQIANGKIFSGGNIALTESKAKLDQVMDSVKVLSSNFDQADDLKRADKIKFAFNEFDKYTVQYWASAQKSYNLLNVSWESFNYLERLSAAVLSSKMVFPSAMNTARGGMIFTLFIPLTVGLVIMLLVIVFAFRPMRKIEKLLKENQGVEVSKAEAKIDSVPEAILAEEVQGSFPTKEQIDMVARPKFVPAQSLPQEAKVIIKLLTEVAFQANMLPLNKIIDESRLGINGAEVEKLARSICAIAKKLTQLERQGEQGIYADVQDIKNKVDYSMSTREVFEEVLRCAEQITWEVGKLVEELKAKKREPGVEYPSVDKVNNAILDLQKILRT